MLGSCTDNRWNDHGNEAGSLLQLGRDFFDATTRRQVPFSAVAISLMGDGPYSIDPVIVSSCVILEYETSETQVDGILTKVRQLAAIFIQ